MFHSIYELKQRTEGIKLRWAIPWIFAQTWNWSQTFCSPGWCYIGYLFLWIPLQVPAMGVVYLHCTLSLLQSLRANQDLSVQPGIGAGWVRGVQTDGCQQGSYQRTCRQKKKALSPPAVLWNLGWKFSRKTNCPHAPLSSAASLRSINSVWNL